jgi:hypothetical protein
LIECFFHFHIDLLISFLETLDIFFLLRDIKSHRSLLIRRLLYFVDFAEGVGARGVRRTRSESERIWVVLVVHARWVAHGWCWWCLQHGRAVVLVRGCVLVVLLVPARYVVCGRGTDSAVVLEKLVVLGDAAMHDASSAKHSRHIYRRYSLSRDIKAMCSDV